MSHKFYIFANGILRDPECVHSQIQAGDGIIAADGGGNHLPRLKIIPDAVVGDMDSIDPGLLTQFEQSGTKVLRYPAEKDQTDLELAIQYALEQGAKEMVIAAGLGGRLDQTLGNLSLLSMPVLSRINLRLEDGVEEAWFLCAGKTEIKGKVGDIVSLLPWGEPVAGIITEGLKYPLENETLYPEKSRGISNELVRQDAGVFVRSGRLLIIHTRK